MDEGEQSCKCPSCLPITFASKKGYFTIVFSVRILLDATLVSLLPTDMKS